jgi:hypothetical protein
MLVTDFPSLPTLMVGLTKEILKYYSELCFFEDER